MIEVIDSQAFWQSLETCYRDHLAVPLSDLCIIHLVLAIGSLLGRELRMSPDNSTSPAPRTSQEQAQESFQAATIILDDLLSLDQPTLWSTRTLTLCTVYHLIVSRWNAAEQCHSTYEVICSMT